MIGYVLREASVVFGFLGYDLLGWGLDIYHLHIKISLLIFISLGLISYILYPLAGFGVVASLIAYSYDVMGAMSVYHYMLDPLSWLGALVGLALCLARLVGGAIGRRGEDREMCRAAGGK